MASMAACLMFSGVGKSGSPAPKSTTSAPSRRNRSASAITFMVDDTLMREILEASAPFVGIGVICIIACSLMCFAHSKLEPLFDQRRHQSRYIAAERSHFLYQLRADERIRFGRHQEHRLYARAQAPVHVGNLQFIFVIRDGPDPAQNEIGAARSDVVHQQAVKGADFDVPI